MKLAELEPNSGWLALQAPLVKGCRMQLPSQLGLAQYMMMPPEEEELVVSQVAL